MRTITAAQTTLLQSPTRADHVRVFVHDGTGFVDLTTLEGENWVRSVTYEEDVNNPTATAKIVLHRSLYNISINPFITKSKLNQGTPQIQIGRNMYIETAVTGKDSKPQTSDWQRVFQGKIFSLDPGGMKPSVTLACRDDSGPIVSNFIEDQQVQALPGPGGEPLQTVIQDILTDNAAGVTLFTPVAPSPAFNVLEYLQQKESVAKAVQTLAQLIGWDVRFRWDDGTSAFRYTLSVPERTSPVVDFTFGPDRYTDIAPFITSLENIRNRVRVVAGPVGARVTAFIEDIASQTKYGIQFMEISEASTSQLDTAAEALRMATAALADLKDPEADFSVTLPFFWPAQLTDYYTFGANDEVFDLDQNGSVVKISHTFPEKGIAKTKFTLRGTPTTGTKKWMQIEGRSGIAPNADFVAPSTPVTISIESEKGAMIISYTRPIESDWDYTRCHIATTGAGFSPGPSNLKAEARTDRFMISGLTPNQQVWVKLIAVDRKGNESVIGTVATTTPRFVSPFDLDPDYEKVNSLYNGEFQAFTPPGSETTQPPDTWLPLAFADLADLDITFTPILTEDAWGAGAGPATDWVYFEETEILTGTKSLKLDAVTSVKTSGGGVAAEINGLASTERPCSEGAVYLLKYWSKAEVVGAITRVRVFFADETRVANTITPSVKLDLVHVSNTKFEMRSVKFKAPVGTRWMAVYAAKDKVVGEIVGDSTFIDRVSIFPDTGGIHQTVNAGSPNAVSVAVNTWTNLVFNEAVLGTSIDWDGDEATITEEGGYDLDLHINMKGVSVGNWEIRVTVNGSEAVTGLVTSAITGGTQLILGALGFALVEDDVVAFQVRHTSGGETGTYSDAETSRNFVTLNRR